MEKNTVTLDIETYNRLRDFENKMVKNNTCVIRNRGSFGAYETFRGFISTDEALEEISNINEELVKKNIDLGNRIKTLVKESDDLINTFNKRLDIDYISNQIKTTSLWKILKLKYFTA